jgi:predicted ATPase with chaperone activity
VSGQSSSLVEFPSSEESLAAVAPRPKRLADTGLSASFLTDLIAKHLFEGGTLTMATLSDRMALSGTILEEVMELMRREAQIEVLGATSDAPGLRYGLTDRGRASALDAMMRSGYIGPAPVPLEKYCEVVKAQTVHDRSITRDKIDQAYDGMVLKEELRYQLGPSMNSGRAIFIYGPAGTGKTYITQRLARLFPTAVLIPYAIAINEVTVIVFDPTIHRPMENESSPSSVLLDHGHDPRFVSCERPVLISGGELTADMLEVRYDADSKQYWAPIQVKAANGVLIIDDMGRQRVAPEAVFNRWIVPLEEKKDYLSLGAGRHFSVPFDVVLIFSTNLHPLDLADEAFLRRIGYKIEFGYLDRDEYQTIWGEVCEANEIECDDGVLDYVIDELHSSSNKPLLPCHPRDLLGLAVDRAVYSGEPRLVKKEHMEWAWKNYFVSMKHVDGVEAQSGEPVVKGD